MQQFSKAWAISFSYPGCHTEEAAGRLCPHLCPLLTSDSQDLTEHLYCVNGYASLSGRDYENKGLFCVAL